MLHFDAEMGEKSLIRKDFGEGKGGAKHILWLIRRILKNWSRADNLCLPAARAMLSHFKVELPGISI